METILQNQSAGSVQIALDLAQVCQISYLTPPKILEKLERQSSIESISVEQVDDLLLITGATVQYDFTVIRGTKGLTNWLYNLDVSETNTQFGDVHSGFLEAANKIIDRLSEVRPNFGSITGRKALLAGHSLGGALAGIIAMLKLDSSDVRRAYIHTFGQPKFADAEFMHSMNGRFGDRFIRYVNGSDVVTRVPPGFSHGGELMRVSSQYQFFSESIEEELETDLSSEEFELLKRRLSEITDSSTRRVGLTQLDRDNLNDTSAEGLIPGIREHRISEYITALSQLVSPPSTERSFPGADAAFEFLDQQEVSLSESVDDDVVSEIDDEVLIPMLVRKLDAAWVPPEGVLVSADQGSFISLRVGRGDIDKILSDRDIVAINTMKLGGTKELTKSVPFSMGTPVQPTVISEEGDKALIGIIDSGLDILHNAFVDDAGVSRVLAIWDQSNQGGPSPNAVAPNVFSEIGGTLYLHSDIEAFRQNPNSIPATLKASLRDKEGHGTHVAGIAAGRATSLIGRGIAPKAGIVVVIPQLKASPNDPFSLGYSVSHLEALSFLKKVSVGGNPVSELPLPIAINVSQGMNAGGHDGQTAVEAMFDSMTSQGRDPGIVIVKSAGNERGRMGHASDELQVDGLSIFEWSSKDISRSQDYFELWLRRGDIASFKLVLPNGMRIGPIGPSGGSLNKTVGGNKISMEFVTNHSDNGDNLLAITIERDTQKIRSGKWALEVEGKQNFSPDGDMHIWVERHGRRAVQFRNPDNDITLSIPGTARSIVTVAAIRPNFPLANQVRSSKGLSRTGHTKPDLSAPGVKIISARSYTSNHDEGIAKSGTSMAAPHVAGALALVMSARHKQNNQPQFNAQQLLSALRNSAQPQTGNHNKNYGFGALSISDLFSNLGL